jgi:fatty acid desaturase
MSVASHHLQSDHPGARDSARTSWSVALALVSVAASIVAAGERIDVLWAVALVCAVVASVMKLSGPPARN